ncbi:MAG: transporter substrate-binding domain-containing protein [Collinsella intestinalis]
MALPPTRCHDAHRGSGQQHRPGFIGDDGNLTGFIDLATEVAARNGWNLELEAIDWDAKDALLNQGTINCIGTASPWSRLHVLEALHARAVVVVKKDSGISSLDDLAGKNVMTQVDSALDVLEGDQKDLADTFAGVSRRPSATTTTPSCS